MSTVLITGGAGFFGGILKRRLLTRGIRCVSIDLQPDSDRDPNLVSIQGDLRDPATLESIFGEHRFDAVYHIAAMLAHGHQDESLLWTSNVDGTRNLAETACRHGVPRLIYTSTNCLWGRNLHRAITEDEPPEPIELYGRSKLEGERILNSYRDRMIVVTVRCPTIIDSGRLGLLAILFEFIRENRRVWTVGGGHNRYQFIYAQDLADACERLLNYSQSDVFNIGADDVKSLREVYEYVIRQTGSQSRVCALPKGLTLLMMRMAYHLGISPLGPYHYKMIAEDFFFDTTRIKQRLGWRPTLTCEEMLLRGYQYYEENQKEIVSRRDVSAHRKPASMGVIRLLKWVS